MLRNGRRPALRVFDAICNAQWAMEESAIRTLMQIALRENLSPEAVAAQLGRPLDNTQAVTIRDGIATIPAVGPMFRYADFFTEISGAVTYEQLALDFQAAMDNRSVKAIVLALDTPGGEVNGLSQLTDLVYAARDVKPVYAHAGDLSASAGYVLASAARRVYATPTAIVGSIGVRTAYRDMSKRDQAAGIETIEFVSSQSPEKSSDPKTEAGKARIQAVIDATAQAIIDIVARNRGVSAETVMTDFGRGGVFVGQGAIDAGLADGIASYESLLEQIRSEDPQLARASSLMSRPSRRAAVPTPQPEATMPEPTSGQPGATPAAPAAPAPGATTTPTPPAAPAAPPATTATVDLDAARKEARETERKRIAGIRALVRAGEDEIAQKCIDEDLTVEAAALRIVEHRNAKGSTQLTALRKDENNQSQPNATTAPTGSSDVSPREAGKAAAKLLHTTTRRSSER